MNEYGQISNCYGEYVDREPRLRASCCGQVIDVPKDSSRYSCMCRLGKMLRDPAANWNMHTEWETITVPVRKWMYQLAS